MRHTRPLPPIDLSELFLIEDCRGAGVAQALARLAVDPKDATGLLLVYEKHRKDFRDCAIRWLKCCNPKLYSRATLNILLRVAERAHEYDPRTMNAADWIKQSAAIEARRIHRQLARRN